MKVSELVTLLQQTDGDSDVYTNNHEIMQVNQSKEIICKLNDNRDGVISEYSNRVFIS